MSTSWKIKSKKCNLSKSEEAVRKRKYRENKNLKAERLKEENRLRQKRAREKLKQTKRLNNFGTPQTSETSASPSSSAAFTSRSKKCRLKRKIKNILPESPTRGKKAELLISLVDGPRTRKAIREKSLNSSLNSSLNDSFSDKNSEQREAEVNRQIVDS